MGADLLITALMLDEGREPDFEAAERATSALQARDVADPEAFDGHDPDEPEGLEEIRAVLRADLRELREAIAGCREMAEMIVRGAHLYLTGGMSWGDSPTDFWEVIARLRAVRGVLAAAGFERRGMSEARAGRCLPRPRAACPGAGREAGPSPATL